MIVGETTVAKNITAKEHLLLLFNFQLIYIYYCGMTSWTLQFSVHNRESKSITLFSFLVRLNFYIRSGIKFKKTYEHPTNSRYLNFYYGEVSAMIMLKRVGAKIRRCYKCNHVRNTEE